MGARGEAEEEGEEEEKGEQEGRRNSSTDIGYGRTLQGPPDDCLF